MIVLSAITILCVTFGIVGLGVGMGATFPRFKFENVTQIADSAGGLLYMIAATSFVAVVLFLETVPVYLYLNAEYRGLPLEIRAWLIIAGALSCVLVVNALAVWLPMRIGAKRLAAMEI